MRFRLILSLLIALITALPLAAQKKDASKDAAAANESAPDVPDAIQVPSGVAPVLFLRAKGSQIYTCQADPQGNYTWTLKAPEAELKDRKDKVVGEHSAGPTWKLKDGSEVTGKATAHVDSLDSDSIPWLLVSVTNNSGKGQLAHVTIVQRVHTHGGKPSSSDVCDASHKDTESKSDYSADYYFFAPTQ